MKRIKEACLLQTIHFQLKEDLPHGDAVQAVRAEVAHYKAQMDRNHTQYKITREEEQSDGSILIHIRKQYNNHTCGSSPAGAALLLFPSWSGGRPGKLGRR